MEILPIFDSKIDPVTGFRGFTVRVLFNQTNKKTKKQLFYRLG